MTDLPSERPPIQFVPRGERPAVRFRRPTYDGCRHQYATVDLQGRTLTCDACQVALDPLTFLYDLAVEWEQRDYKLAKMAEFEAKQARLAEQSRERTRKRLERSGVPYAVGDGPVQRGGARDGD